MKKFASIILVCVMLISAVVPTYASDTGIEMHLNGNEITDTGREININNGIFSATTSGAGVFALAFYKNRELVSVQFAEDEDLSSARLNMVVDSDSLAYDYIKIFRFDEDGTPVDTYNKILKPTKNDENLRVYFNETFDNNESRYEYTPNGTYVRIENERLKISGKGKGISAWDIKHPSTHTVIEADFELPDKEVWSDCVLVGYYSGAPIALVRMRGSGIWGGNGGTASTIPHILKDEIRKNYFKEDGKFKLSVVIDLDSRTYSVYIDDKKCDFKIGSNHTTPYVVDIPLPDGIDDSGFSASIAYTKEKANIYVDNIRAYSGKESLDIGNAIPNVHNTDIQAESINHSIYERPSAAQIAKRTIEKGHPRVIINADKVAKIKNSDDANIKAWRNSVIEKADAALNEAAMTWEQYNPSDESLDDVPVALETVMNLGLAYQLSSDAVKKQKYADKAYEWAEVLMNFKGWHEDSESWVENDWNSDSYLDVGEISTIISICYDWLYDAWTKEQKKELVESIMRSSIDISYKSYFNQPIKNGGETDTSWWDSTNNWNAVCNGGVLVAALAFMEEDIYRCSRLAEGTIRGFEYILPKFAPAGAWSEGTSYWAYTFKYLTIACSTLENCCGTLYGIDKTEGLEDSQTYSLSLEGKTGTFGFGDVGGGDHTKASFMYYWARIFNDSAIAAAANYAMDKFGFTPNIFDLIYYDPDFVSNSYTRPLSSYRKGTEVVTFASGDEETDTAIAIVGGKGNATSHDHLDSGSIIVDMNGVRIIGDTGAEHYDAISYFSTNRFWYYKARPEGHNIFVINPNNLYKEDGTYYHGQSESAVSKINEDTYDEENQKATMDLTQAYLRDASNAKRTISLDGKKAVIEDEITLKSDGSLIEWYYHFADILSYTPGNKTYYKNGTTYCEYKVDGNSVEITYKLKLNADGKGYTVLENPKKFKISFVSESGTDFEIEVADAMRRHENNKAEFNKIRENGELSYDYYTYYRGPEYIDKETGEELEDKYEKNGNDFMMDKIIVKMNDASETVKLKTIIEAVE